MKLLDMNFVGKYYHKFFEKELKKYNYISKQDGFNMSMCDIDDKMQLFCVRILGTIEAYFGENIIPGNYSKKYSGIKVMSENTLKLIRSIGKNFFWNNWTDNNLIESSILFVGYYNDKELIINENIKPTVIFNMNPFLNIKACGYRYGDIRLFKANNRIFCIDGMVSAIFDIKIHNNKIDLPLNRFRTDDDYFNIYLCNFKDENYYYKQYDKNWSFLDIIDNNKLGKSFSFLCWFEKGYVTIINIQHDKDKYFVSKCIKYNIIEMKKDKIDGLGSDYLPMFSFGTPTININLEKKVFYDRLGSGHVKIIRSKKYNNNKLNQFKMKLEKYYDKFFSDKYIEHTSYMYLMYFFRIIKYDNLTYKMFISDIFLPLNMKEKDIYQFSIIYPMGLININNKLYVSGGYGDYYNVILTFGLDDVIKSCVHDIEYFDADSLNFNVLYV